MSFSFKNTKTQYGVGGRILHWTSVALLVTLILTADNFKSLDTSLEKTQLIGLHVSWGLLFIAVISARVVWRARNLNPIHSYSIRDWQKFTAIFLHWSIYVLVLTLSISGLLNLVFNESGIPVFSYFEIPVITSNNGELRELFGMLHYILSVLVYPLIAIHITAAIYHQLFGVLDEEE